MSGPAIAFIVFFYANTQILTSESNMVHVSVKKANTGQPLEFVRISPTAGQQAGFSDLPDDICDSYRFIQTPRWRYGIPHPVNIHSIVRVNVPENHMAMFSLLRLNLICTCSKCDWDQVRLDIYETRMTPSNMVWSCSRSFIWLKVILRQQLPSGSDLYVHFQCGNITENTRDGFRLFFSVTNESTMLQVERNDINSDLWNCSVPNYADFKPHFPCDLTPQCINKEDERDCPYTSDECGLGFIYLGKYCLVYVRSRIRRQSWTDNVYQCQQRGMRLATFRTHEDYERLAKFLDPMAAYLGFRKIAVGIHTTSVSLPVMYRNALQNSDETIGLNHWIQIKRMQRTVCGWIMNDDAKRYRTHISFSYCTCEASGQSALCETLKPMTAVSSFTKSFQLQSVSRPNNSHLSLFGCPLGHVTRDFLACDGAASCWSRDVMSCAAPLTPLPPRYSCTNGLESVPYTLVCDLRPDCRDNSDESFCEFPPCDLPEPFYCSDSECVPWGTVCDGERNCYNAADEDTCSQRRPLTVERPLPPVIVHLFRGQFLVQRMNNAQLAQLSPAVCPETHFQCPGYGYCMPVFLRCNEFYDCPGKEDESDCDSYTCPDFYRCRGCHICLHPQQVCDGILHCPQNDDELLCDLSCPESCTCYGLSFYCRHTFHTGQFTKLRFLDSRGSGMDVSDLTKNVMLIYLSLAANRLTSVGEINCPNLRIFDLSDNQITEIRWQHLINLSRLEVLSLSGNPLLSLFQCDTMAKSPTARIMSDDSSLGKFQNNMSGEATTVTDHPMNIYETISIKSPIFSYSINVSVSGFNSDQGNVTMPSLRSLDLSRVRIRILNPSFMSVLPNLHTINMSGCGVDTLLGEGFQTLTQLRTLDLRGCPLTYFPRDVFRGLGKLETVHSDNHKLCCSATLPTGFISKNCYAPCDEISSCEALLRSLSYRMFLYAFASFALLGNSSSFVYRMFFQKRKRLLGFDVFVVHLCLSDFFMGVYLSVIGVADRLYRGTYLWEDNTWKASTVCHMAGFLSLVSCEVSALIICLITIDRFLVLRFPFSTFHFGTRSAHVTSLCVWGIGCLIAVVPLIPGMDHWQFYSQTGICIPLPVSRHDFPGSTYAFGVMIVANFVFFLVIAAGQIFIYWSVRTMSLSAGETTKKTQDLTIARRLITVAMSDFLCWFPLGLAGMLAATGVPIASEVSVAMAIFVLPFNSALNPFLYTLNIVLEKRRQADMKRVKEQLMAQLLSAGIEKKNPKIT